MPGAACSPCGTVGAVEKAPLEPPLEELLLLDVFPPLDVPLPLDEPPPLDELLLDPPPPLDDPPPLELPPPAWPALATRVASVELPASLPLAAAPGAPLTTELSLL